jgi:hypothetical protein
MLAFKTVVGDLLHFFQARYAADGHGAVPNGAGLSTILSFNALFELVCALRTDDSTVSSLKWVGADG